MQSFIKDNKREIIFYIITILAVAAATALGCYLISKINYEDDILKVLS